MTGCSIEELTFLFVSSKLVCVCVCVCVFNISAYLCFPLILLRFKGGHWQNYTNRVFTAQQSLDPHLEFYVGGTGINANEKPGQIC